MRKPKRETHAVAAVPRGSRYGAAPLLGGVLILFTYLYAINAWMSDDAYISFRTIDNLFQGYGLRWNVVERVQAYTNPLWLFVIMLPSFFTREFYFTSLAVSYLLCLGTLGIVWISSRGGWPFLASALMLLSSKAFVDFTSSGLESPLSYFLIALFWSLLPTLVGAQRPSTRRLLLIYLVAALAFVNRADALLLVGLPVLALAWKDAKAGRIAAFSRLMLGFLAAIAWELFSLVYYGFLLPNTYYAKLEIHAPASAVLYQGVEYFIDSLGLDPITLVVVFATVVLLLISRRAVPMLGAFSILLYLGYTLMIGGDFMSGRFFALPFLLAVLLIAPGLAQRRYVSPAILGLLLLYNLVNPHSPLKTAPIDPNQPFTWRANIDDEAEGYRRGTSLLLYWPLGSLTQSEFPTYEQYRSSADAGLQARNEKIPVIVASGTGTGFLGYYAGPDVYIIDIIALSDPLLARLPEIESMRNACVPGHTRRVLPIGYCESALRGENRVAQPALREYYEQVRLVTRGDLFSVERWKAIWKLNSVLRTYRGDVGKVVPLPDGCYYLTGKERKALSSSELK